MRRRQTLALGAGLGASLALPGLAQTPPPAADPGLRILRYAFPIAESSFDPPQITDVYSRTVITHIFEGLYTYDHLARPARIVPLTALGMPEVSADFRTWTVSIQPGIFFADDPALGGRPRELVAADFAYVFKRCADPATKSPLWSNVDALGFSGLAEARRQTLERKQPFDYDRPLEGLRVLDRHTVQFHTHEPRPRLIEALAISGQYGAVAREVVDFYGNRIGEHPVGTGPFRLAQWRRSSLIVLERNPAYRVRLWHSEPAPDDAEGQAIAARLRGRRLPLLDRVEVSIIEESQPRWLSFLNGQTDLIDRVPPEFINAAMPGGAVAPNLARQGIRGARVLQPDVAMTYYNMEDPVVGGYAPHQVALRRAMNLGVDVEREIRLVRRGMAIPAQSPVLPHMSGYDPAFKSENSEYNPARAKALLDLYGYIDRDGDGWRERPDGSLLHLEYATQPDQASRQLNELWQKNMAALGIRIRFKTAKWPENLKAARAGSLQMWGVGSTATSGDGQDMLRRYHGKQLGQQNLSRFALPAFDAVYDQLAALPDGLERQALFDQAKRLAVAWAPYKLHVHRYAADMMHPWVVGYRRPPFWNEWWHMVDVDPAARRRSGRPA
ncbi:MAG: ABC transporter substrate-binding protein [Rubrivivax sp.]|nr:ABC transporter substrate-binding protein [Rubrivivax sp.]